MTRSTTTVSGPTTADRTAPTLSAGVALAQTLAYQAGGFTSLYVRHGDTTYLVERDEDGYVTTRRTK